MNGLMIWTGPPWPWTKRGLELLQQVPPSETLGSTLDCRTSVMTSDTRSLTLALDCSVSSSSSIFLGFWLKLLDRSAGYIRSSPTRNCSSELLPWRLWLPSALLDVVSPACISSAEGWTLQSDPGEATGAEMAAVASR